MTTTSNPHTSRRSSPTLLEIVEETLDLATGLITALLPLFLLSAPVLVPTAVVGGVIIAALALVAGAVAALIGAPLLLLRMIWRGRGGSRPA